MTCVVQKIVTGKAMGNNVQQLWQNSVPGVSSGLTPGPYTQLELGHWMALTVCGTWDSGVLSLCHKQGKDSTGSHLLAS